MVSRCWDWSQSPLPGVPLAALRQLLRENLSTSHGRTWAPAANPAPLPSPPPPPCTVLPWKASRQAQGLLNHPFSCWHCSCGLRDGVEPVGAWWDGWSSHCEGFRCALLQTIAVCPHYICPSEYKQGCLFCIVSCISSLWGAAISFSSCRKSFFLSRTAVVLFPILVLFFFFFFKTFKAWYACCG